MYNDVAVIILAAGFGRRLMPYTEHNPKCMIEFSGKTLLEHQLELYKNLGITDVNIVTGHCPESVQTESIKVRKFFNPDYEKSNMMYSTLCAKNLFDGKKDIVIAYGDIIFNQSVLEKLLESKNDISLITDLGWEDYWRLRIEDIESDVETFKWDPNSQVVFELGKKPKSLNDVQGQYIGLFKISKSFAAKFIRLYEDLDTSKNSTKNIYMTDFLQYIIDSGYPVYGNAVRNGWLEFDSVDDLDAYNQMLKNKTLSEYYDTK